MKFLAWRADSRWRPPHPARRHAICRVVVRPLADWWWPVSLNPLERTTSMINFIVWLIVGGLVGWIASMIMRTDAQQGVILNVVVGIIGAAVAGWLISPLVGVPSINQQFSVGAFVVSLLGAIVLLGIVNLFRRGMVR
jgi:uncharacterized membrane protein YeaQ/YmgE (transglycosylase-associated protein family)